MRSPIVSSVDRRPLVWVAAAAIGVLLIAGGWLLWRSPEGSSSADDTPGGAGASSDRPMEADDSRGPESDDVVGSTRGDGRGGARPGDRRDSRRGVVRDASAASAESGYEDGGAASFARRRAAFALAVNEMLAALPPKAFPEPEPDIAWQRGFGHTLRVNNAPLRVCWMNAEARHGDRGGLVGYELRVGPDGRVIDAAITVDPIDDAGFANCLLRALNGLTFPRSSRTVAMQAGLLVGGSRYRGARPARSASHPDDGLTFVHALRGLGPMPE